MNAEALSGGFADAPVQAAHGFRAVLQALSSPGTIIDIFGARPPAPMSAAAGSVALVLLDSTTPVHLAGAHDCPDVRAWITFHTGAPLVRAEAAVFAFGDWAALQPVNRFAIGTAEYPDRAATLVIEVPALAPVGAVLRGPGIEATARLSLPETNAFQINRARFPLGFDALLTCAERVAGLPRSTIVEDFA